MVEVGSWMRGVLDMGTWAGPREGFVVEVG